MPLSLEPSRDPAGPGEAGGRPGDAALIELLGRTRLFRGLTREQRATVVGRLELRRYAPDEVILVEGEVDHAIHVVARGRVVVLKATAGGAPVEVRTLERGACLGEIKLFGHGRSTATVRAKGHVVCGSLAIDLLKRNGPLGHLRSALVQSAGKLLGERMSTNTADVVEAMRGELVQSQMRLFAGRLMLLIVTLMSLFTLFISLMSSVAPELLPRPEVLSFGLIVPAAAFMSIGLVLGPYTARDAGVHLDQPWAQVKRALWYTAPLMVLGLGVKLLLSRPGGPYADRPLLDPGALFPEGGFEPTVYALALAGYVIHAPLQELLIRAGLQFPMEKLLSPTSTRVNWLAIIVSNLCFAAFHTYLGFGFALVAFGPGVYWGWIYARERSMFVSTMSHWLLGVWALFVLGLQSSF